VEKLNFLTLFWLHPIQILSWNPISLWRYNLHYYLVWADFLLLFLPSLPRWSHLLFGQMIKNSKRAQEATLHFYIVERDEKIHVERSEIPWAGNFFEALISGSAPTWTKNYPSLEQRLRLLQVSSSQQFKLWRWFFSSPKEVAFCIWR